MKWLKLSAVVFGAVVITALGIDAADTLQGSRSTLLGQIVATENSTCPEGMTETAVGGSFVCVDLYEASPSSNCPYPDTTSHTQTQQNMNEADCIPASVKGAQPWRFVSFMQAQQLCAKDGKRLPLNEEWHDAASGLNDTTCTTNAETPLPTGSTECISPGGIHDMVGNVWEWVDAQIQDGTYEDRTIPESGYVAMVDTTGVVLQTTQTGQPDFGNDYAWTNTNGVRGMIRGGFYNSGEDAGIFAQNLSVALDLKTDGVGFRCVRDL